jgi:hypothetical protein
MLQLELIPLKPPIPAPRDLSHIHKYETRSKCAMHGVQGAI